MSIDKEKEENLDYMSDFLLRIAMISGNADLDTQHGYLVSVKNDSGEYISVKGRYPYFLKDRTYYTKLDGAEEYQRLVFADDPIIEQLLKKITKYNFIVGAGTAESTRKNSLELDYQGNLNTSGDIVNGDGVILGASISNEVLDNIWNEVFA